MKKSHITQQNVHLLLPTKVTHLAARLLRDGHVTDEIAALRAVYASPVYAKLERESTKYWWFGINALYDELLAPKP
mgnify:CR=1 FL=1